MKCPFSQKAMDKALVELRSEGVLYGKVDEENIDFDKLREYIFKATEKLTNIERVATLCLSGVCLLGNDKE